MSDALPDPIDMVKLRQRFDDDDVLLAEIFKVFTSEAPGRQSGITAALAAGDMEELTRRAHSLKGVSGTMFAEPLRQAAYDLEMAAHAGDAAAVAQAVPVVLSRLEATVAFLEHCIA